MSKDAAQKRSAAQRLEELKRTHADTLGRLKIVAAERHLAEPQLYQASSTQGLDPEALRKGVPGVDPIDRFVTTESLTSMAEAVDSWMIENKAWLEVIESLVDRAGINHPTVAIAVACKKAHDALHEYESARERVVLGKDPIEMSWGETSSAVVLTGLDLATEYALDALKHRCPRLGHSIEIAKLAQEHMLSMPKVVLKEKPPGLSEEHYHELSGRLSDLGRRLAANEHASKYVDVPMPAQELDFMRAKPGALPSEVEFPGAGGMSIPGVEGLGKGFEDYLAVAGNLDSVIDVPKPDIKAKYGRLGWSAGGGFLAGIVYTIGDMVVKLGVTPGGSWRLLVGLPLTPVTVTACLAGVAAGLTTYFAYTDYLTPILGTEDSLEGLELAYLRGWPKHAAKKAKKIKKTASVLSKDGRRVLARVKEIMDKVHIFEKGDERDPRYHEIRAEQIVHELQFLKSTYVRGFFSGKARAALLGKLNEHRHQATILAMAEKYKNDLFIIW